MGDPGRKVWKFLVWTSGCRVNQADGDALSDALAHQGHERVASVPEADLLVVNTCTVTHRSDHDARNMVRRMHRENPDARIIVTGCFASRKGEELGRMPGVVFTAGPGSAAEVARFLGEFDGASPPGPPASPATLELAVAHHGHTRPFVKVQDGCPGGCAYCIVPFVRGGPRSASPERVVEAVRALVAGGTREIILTGIHLGLYGVDLPAPASLAGLTRTLLEETGIERIRFSSIEPQEFHGELLELIAGQARIAPHFHIPLQSGCDGTLARMNRPGRTGSYAELVRRLLSLRPSAAVGADVIVGFPGETEDEFARTAVFLEGLPLAYLHVFPFSPRPGTAAASFPDQLPPAVVKERARRLLALGKQLRTAFQRRFFGQTLEALTLGPLSDRPGTRAMTDNYIPVYLPDRRLPPNEPVRLRILGFHEQAGCLGQVVAPTGGQDPAETPSGGWSSVAGS